MPIGTRHVVDPNFKPGGSLGVIEQLDLTTSYPQTVAILDGSGNQITSFGGGTQYTEGGTPPASPIGPTIIFEDTGVWKAISVANPLPVLASIDTTGLATSAKQLPDGHNVTVDNSTGAAAVNIQDGGNTITVDGAVTTSGTVTEASAADIKTAVQLIDNAVSGAGFNITQVNGEAIDVGAGTEAAAIRVTLPTDGTGKVTAVSGTAANLKVAATLDAETTKVIGTVNQGTSPWVVSGAVTNTVLSVVGTGTEAAAQRVTIATDSTGLLSVDDNGGALTVDNAGTFAVQAAATLNAETTKVIGVVRTADGSGNLLTSTTNALDINIKSGTVTTHPVTVASGGIASGAVASGAIASGAVASGAIASGAIAAGSIAVGAITAGDTSIATTEDTARAAGEHIVKVGISRLDTPVANANVGTDGDYTNITADNFGKIWVAGAIPEDTAHISGEALNAQGSRRIATLATSSGADADWSTVNQTNEGAAWASLAATATPNGLLIGNFTSGDTYTALTNGAQVIKASAGNLYGYYFFNPNTAATYVLIYNIAAASVTVGTSTAALVFCIPASSAANLMLPVPIPFSNAGWSIAAATTGGGNTAPTTALEAMVFYL